MKSFSVLLRDARKRAGLSQVELANRVNIDPSYISRIERGLYDPPSREKVLAIVTALEITGIAERIEFLAASYHLGGEDLDKYDKEKQKTSTPVKSLPFGGGDSFYFPEEQDNISLKNLEYLDEDVVKEQLDRLLKALRNSDLSKNEREEYVEQISSFFDWLTFRLKD